MFFQVELYRNTNVYLFLKYEVDFRLIIVLFKVNFCDGQQLKIILRNQQILAFSW